MKLSNSSLALRLSGRSEDFWVLRDITVDIVLDSAMIPGHQLALGPLAASWLTSTSYMGPSMPRPPLGGGSPTIPQWVGLWPPSKEHTCFNPCTLTDLTRRTSPNVVQWNDECTKTFKTLKQCLC